MIYLKMIPVNASGYWWNASSLAKLEDIHDYLDEIPEMGKVLSAASGIKLLE